MLLLINRLHTAFGDLLIRLFSLLQTIWFPTATGPVNSYGGFGTFASLGSIKFGKR